MIRASNSLQIPHACPWSRLDSFLRFHMPAPEIYSEAEEGYCPTWDDCENGDGGDNPLRHVLGSVVKGDNITERFSSLDGQLRFSSSLAWEALSHRLPACWRSSNW